LQKLTAAAHTTSEQYGLKINTTKTKAMTIGKKKTVVKINVGQQPAEQLMRPSADTHNGSYGDRYSTENWKSIC